MVLKMHVLPNGCLKKCCNINVVDVIIDEFKLCKDWKHDMRYLDILFSFILI